MELDDLKQIWHRKESFLRKHEQEIAMMLKGSSKSPIAKLKRNLWFELIYTGVAWLIMLYYALTLPSGALKWSFISFLVLFLGYMMYYLQQLRLFRDFETKKDLRTNLEHLVGELDKYIRFYRLSYSVLYPVFLVLILLFVIIDRGMDNFLDHISSVKTLVTLLFLVGLFFASSLWFANWYLKRMYGNHIDKLRELLKDINSNGE
jgi:glucan phosphoethanolaminetransferase (alkaline phosphatase superfamily)